ncbi:MAG: DnaJ domain-containing protein [Nitrospirae bacterium]|uniref:J domain-containing protein n=1 Tax=Candidatus Magnetobacterium casense TaxID=1455061 RepID=UPI00058E0DB6|nr:J domain-containing protein [Candidatus Magnetobacterium casensis]MBF0337302.1 DnaJ domain-containing protein [Nitrospirota bacterium]
MDGIEKYYEVLGITAGASENEIKDAYRDSIKVWHPDRFAVENERLKKKSEDKTKEINDAYRKILEHRKNCFKPRQEQKTPGHSNKESCIYDVAIADYTRAIEINPRNAVAYVSRGNTWFKTDVLGFDCKKSCNPLTLNDYSKLIVSTF